MEQTILSNALIEGAGSFAGGFLCGYALKKIIKVVMIIVGAIAGIFLVALALMQKQGYVSVVNWDSMTTDLYTFTNTTLTNFHMNSIQHTVSYLGLPISSGLGLGLIMGFMKG